MLVSATGCGGQNLLHAAPAVAEPGRAVHVVVEIPAGSTAKWEVGQDGTLAADRPIDYLGFSANYGFVPSTRSLPRCGGDGDALDVLLLGAPASRGSLTRGRPVAVLHLRDDGEWDDKIVAVPTSGPFSVIRTLADLRRRYPGATEILEIWLTHYDPAAELESRGWGSAETAWRLVEASRVGAGSCAFRRAPALP